MKTDEYLITPDSSKFRPDGVFFKNKYNVELKVKIFNLETLLQVAFCW